jgi:hypothetical protein
MDEALSPQRVRSEASGRSSLVPIVPIGDMKNDIHLWEPIGIQ